MLYQPENFNECLKIECINCLTRSHNMCLQFREHQTFNLIPYEKQQLILKNYSKNILKIKRGD